jgi:hypothetical protein
MASATVTLHISRPVADVFAFVSRYDNNVKWQEGVVSSRQITPGDPGVGTQVAYTRELLGQRAETQAQIIEFDADRRIRIQSKAGPFNYKGGYDFSAEGSGTRVVYRGEIEAASRLLGFLGSAVASRFQTQMESDLGRLKTLLERTA